MPKTTPTKSGEKAERRRQAVLLHIGHYRMSLVEVLGRHFYAAQKGIVKKKNVDNLLKPLREKKLIRSERFEGGSSVYYQLTAEGAKYVGLAKSTANRLNPLPLQQSLALLWCCWLGPKPRYKFSPQEAAQLVQAVLPAGTQEVCPEFEAYFASNSQKIHCLERGERRVSSQKKTRSRKKGSKKSVPKPTTAQKAKSPEHRIWRVRVADAGKSVDSLLDQLLEDYEEAQELLELRPWLDAKKYAFILLTPSKETVKAIKQARKYDKRFKEFHVYAEFAPTPIHLKEALQAL